MKKWRALILGVIISIIVPIVTGIVTYNCYKGEEPDSEIKEVSDLVIKQLRSGGARTTYDDLGKFFDFDIVVESAIMRCGYQDEMTYELDSTEQCLSAHIIHGESRAIIRISYDYSTMVLLEETPDDLVVKITLSTFIAIIIIWLMIVAIKVLGTEKK